MPLPDQIELLVIQERIADGDQGALRVLYNYYSDRLLQLAYTIVRSKEMAEEVVEDVFIQVWQKRERMRTVEKFSFYLYMMTRNIGRSHLRKYGAKKHFPLDEVSVPYYHITITPEDLLITGETLQRINKAINDLPPQCRLIFKLVKEDGLKYKEVAELLQLTPKTVENQMGIALRKIQAMLALILPASR